ncbi:MAG: phosphodiester glycosidase family protein [Candidatus Zhuqueibacterota bacterium]
MKLSIYSIFVTLTVLLVLPDAKGSSIDSHVTRPVGPGIFYHEIYQNEGPWSIRVLEIDLTNQFVSLETIKANSIVAGREKLSRMAKSASSDGHWVVGGINADFFSSSGIPHGIQVIDGKLLTDPSGWSVFGLTRNRKPFIDKMSLQASVVADEGVSHPIHHINKTGAINEMTLFSSHVGPHRVAAENSIELILRSTNGQLHLCNTLIVVVDSILSTSNGFAVPESGFILAADGRAQKFIESYAAVGDTWKIFIAFQPSYDILEAISGGPRIIRNGGISVENADEGISDAFATARHPRSAIGFNKEGTHIYFIAVDGRQPGYSVGMSLYELSDLMIQFGITEAVNLDGGGSTTLVVRDSVVNRPSDDSGERTVANAILAVSTAPLGPLSTIEIEPERAKIVANSEFDFRVHGYDQYFNPIPVDQKSIVWEVKPGSFESSKNGLISFNSNIGPHIIIAHNNDLVDTAYVDLVNISAIELQPNPIVLELGGCQQMLINIYDNEGFKINQKLSYNAIVSNAIGTLDSNFVFQAQRPGRGQLKVTKGDVSGSASIIVGDKSTTIIEDFEDISDWTVSTLRATPEACQFVLSDSFFYIGSHSGELQYHLESGGTSAVYCQTSIPVFGEPYAISLSVLGDAKSHWLRGEFEDRNGHLFIMDFTEKIHGIHWKNEWKHLQATLSSSQPSWTNPSATIKFPITWKKLYIAETDEKAKNSGIIYFDNLQAEYIQTP